MNGPRRLLTCLLPTLLLAGLLVGSSSSAHADEQPHIYGYVTGITRKGSTVPARTMTVRLFSSDAKGNNWTYLRSTKVKRSGIYNIATNGPGHYHLQLVDRRPSYNVDSWARVPDVKVRVGSQGAVKNVKVRVGGALYGKVKVRGKKASSALIRAVGNNGQIYESKADRTGSYALGGLAKDSYRVFAYDAKKRRVGSGKLVRHVKLRSFRGASFNLRTRPSAYRGFLRVGGKLAKKSVTVTAVNNRTGEYWVKRVRGGAISLRGLTAGSYTLTVPDTEGYFGRTVRLRSVKAGRTRSASVNLRTKAGTITGTAVDAQSGRGIPNISVRLIDARGKIQQETPASSTGSFTLGRTLRPQSGVRVVIFAYDRIGEHYYVARTFSGLTIRNNSVINLNRLSGDTVAGRAVIKIQRKPVTSPTTSTPTTPAPTATTPTPTATTPTPTATTPEPTATTQEPAVTTTTPAPAVV